MHLEADGNDRAATYRALRSVFEAPILDDYKWAKIPEIDADMFFVDLEDSVPPSGKEKARDRAVTQLLDEAHFGGRLTLARPNHLSTPWGHDDVVAFAEAGATCVAYPKISSVDDLIELIELFEKHGTSPDIFAIIETANSVVELRDIARLGNVVALMSGPGDLSVDLDIPLYATDGQLNPFFQTTKYLTVLAGIGQRLAVTDIAYCQDIRDVDEVRRRVIESRRIGFTAMSTFYPPHVAIINDVFTPDTAAVAEAEALIHAYEEVVADGRPASLTTSGEAILVHDYHRAKTLLLKAARTIPT